MLDKAARLLVDHEEPWVTRSMVVATRVLSRLHSAGRLDDRLKLPFQRRLLKAEAQAWQAMGLTDLEELCTLLSSLSLFPERVIDRLTERAYRI